MKWDDFELWLMKIGILKIGMHRRLQNVGKNIPQFHKKGKFNFHFEKISNANSDLLPILTTNQAVYNHSCFLKFRDSKLERFNEGKIRFIMLLV